MIISLAALCLALLIAWFLVKPHLYPVIASTYQRVSQDIQGTLDQRDRCLQVLKDLELDYHMNKITDSDYQQMKVALSQELAGLFQKIDGIKKS